MKKLAVVLALCSMSYALQAPYLISATATSDNSVLLTWRNNDISTTGFIVQRKDSTEATYKFIDSVKSATTLSFVDSKSLLPATLYTYQVIAYNPTEASDTSNSVQATTLVRPRIAPRLTGVTALSVNSVGLAWSDNGTSTQGFILQRKDPSDTAFHFVDSIKSALTLIYTDTTGLRSWTSYSYRVIAYDAMDVQDTSNIMQVRTKQEIFKNPGISVSWNFETSSSVQILFSDSSNCEIGYRIYRADGFSSGSNRVATIASSHPDSMRRIEWDDNTVILNQWYRYKVEAYKSDSSIFSIENKVLTLHSVPMNTTVSFQKLSDVPATLSGLSVKAGDSIIFKENPSPAGKFTVINVIDPLNPKFDGYIDSTALLSYPQQTLIPAFLKFGVYNSGWQTRVMRSKDMVLVSNGAVLSMYKIANDSLVFIRDSVISQGYTIRQMLLFTDTLACVIADYSYSSSGNNPLPWSTFYKYSFIYPVQLASSGFSCFPGYQIPAINDASTSFTLHSSTSTSSAGYFNIHGCHDNNIIMSIRQWKTSFYTVMTNPPNTSQDSSASVAVTDAHGSDQTVIPLGNPDAGWPNASAANTGCSLSPTEYVYSAGPALFVADIRDLPDGYHTAAANNAVYGDSGAGALQNILLDTITKKAYVFYASKLSILSYQRQAVDVANGSNKLTALKGISIIPHTSLSGVTIVLPSNCRSADLFIYGINGRVVDRMRNVSARFVFWRPKTRSTGFYIAVVKSERTRYVSKFMVQ